MAVDLNGATVLLDDLLHDAQTLSRAVNARRKTWVEDVRQIIRRDNLPGVADRQLYGGCATRAILAAGAST